MFEVLSRLQKLSGLFGASVPRPQDRLSGNTSKAPASNPVEMGELPLVTLSVLILLVSGTVFGGEKRICSIPPSQNRSYPFQGRRAGAAWINNTISPSKCRSYPFQGRCLVLQGELVVFSSYSTDQCRTLGGIQCSRENYQSNLSSVDPR